MHTKKMLWIELCVYIYHFRQPAGIQIHFSSKNSSGGTNWKWVRCLWCCRCVKFAFIETKWNNETTRGIEPMYEPEGRKNSEISNMWFIHNIIEMNALTNTHFKRQRQHPLSKERSAQAKAYTQKLCVCVCGEKNEFISTFKLIFGWFWFNRLFITLALFLLHSNHSWQFRFDSKKCTRVCVYYIYVILLRSFLSDFLSPNQQR